METIRTVPFLPCLAYHDHCRCGSFGGPCGRAQRLRSNLSLLSFPFFTVSLCGGRELVIPFLPAQPTTPLYREDGAYVPRRVRMAWDMRRSHNASLPSPPCLLLVLLLPR